MKIRVVLSVFAVAGTFVGQAFSADSTAATAASTNKSTAPQDTVNISSAGRAASQAQPAGQNQQPSGDTDSDGH